MKKTIFIFAILLYCGIKISAQTADSTNRSTKDQVVSGNLYIKEAICAGIEITNGYDYGSNVMALKDKVIRMLFYDNSSDTYPNLDWKFEINSNTPGGENYFKINLGSYTGGDFYTYGTPFTIEAAAPDNSLYISQTTGYIGLGTNQPAVSLHIKDTDTPTICTEIELYGHHIWDISANHSAFFIKSVTNSGKIPFKIDAGTPSNTVTIKSSGKVGIGVSTPEHKLEVEGDMQVDDYLYLGKYYSANWRIKTENGKLIFEKKVGDNWVVSNEFE